MMYRLAPLALLLVMAAPVAGADDPLPGRDGSYQLEGTTLEGTVWEGRLIPEANMIVRFERGGVLAYSYSGQTHRKGSWKQTGSTIYMETNGKYAEYRGVIRGDRILGYGSNVRPFAWKWDLKRRPELDGKGDLGHDMRMP